MNKDSEDLWVEYIKFEMGFVETLRRRWEVLGIEPGKAEGGEEEEEGVEQVMRGAIVKTVIEEAGKALGARTRFFERLLELVEGYPILDEVKAGIRETVYEQVRDRCWGEWGGEMVVCAEGIARNRSGCMGCGCVKKQTWRDAGVIKGGGLVRKGIL